MLPAFFSHVCFHIDIEHILPGPAVDRPPLQFHYVYIICRKDPEGLEQSPGLVAYRIDQGRFIWRTWKRFIPGYNHKSGEVARIGLDSFLEDRNPGNLIRSLACNGSFFGI